MMQALNHNFLIRNEDLEMKLPVQLKRQYLKLKPFKTLVIIVFIYPILPLGLLATLVTFGSAVELLIKGFQSVSWERDLLKYLLVSGGLSGLIAGAMVLTNRVNSSSLLLFLHGAISYTFIAVNFLFISNPPWYESIILQRAYNFTLPNILWILHKSYIALTLVVVTYLLYLIVKKVIADYQTVKKVDTTVFEEA